jgi:hypothetical protein
MNNGREYDKACQYFDPDPEYDPGIIGFMTLTEIYMVNF